MRKKTAKEEKRKNIGTQPGRGEKGLRRIGAEVIGVGRSLGSSINGQGSGARRVQCNAGVARCGAMYVVTVLNTDTTSSGVVRPQLRATAGRRTQAWRCLGLTVSGTDTGTGTSAPDVDISALVTGDK